ncbi:hypothetical protein FB567DRAFT_324960 [Paraphoma chrysanthemicola]|uniref:Zn(2)-C6 fungal-type domain-containing protein n=1 Tax=Paraphoma chrysanthemicola TaxID=798071 RepID=A0A8K0W0E1_9PLEO|nr:hypothetical protein FB567DRAFT_324960 [Paraphoma chrysanthemicola]
MNDAANPAPYGKSCSQCVRAKCRCMIRSEGACERCVRLNKECVPSSSVRKKSSRKTASSKRTQLEDKLDDIVNLLRTQSTRLAPLIYRRNGLARILHAMTISRMENFWSFKSCT